MTKNTRNKLKHAVISGNEREMRNCVNDLLRAKPFARVVGMIENMYRHGSLVEGKDGVLKVVERQSMKKGNKPRVRRYRDPYPIRSAQLG
jgi:hypothetical protein